MHRKWVFLNAIILTVSDLIISTVAKLEPFLEHTISQLNFVFQNSANKKIKFLGRRYVSLFPEWLFQTTYCHHCTERSCFQTPLFCWKLWSSRVTVVHNISLKLDFRNSRKVVINMAGQVLFASSTGATKIGWLKLSFNITCPNLYLSMSRITKTKIRTPLWNTKLQLNFTSFWLLQNKHLELNSSVKDMLFRFQKRQFQRTCCCHCLIVTSWFQTPISSYVPIYFKEPTHC